MFIFDMATASYECRSCGYSEARREGQDDDVVLAAGCPRCTSTIRVRAADDFEAIRTAMQEIAGMKKNG